MRFYIKIVQKLINGKAHTIKQSFITFKPTEDYITFNVPIISPILTSLMKNNMYTDNMGCGIGHYNDKVKVWVAPYGNQVEFMDSLTKGIKPFMNIKDYTRDEFDGILHYVGYFPNLDCHQIYYYLGKNNKYDCIDDRLKTLNPDYFGFSRTYDKNWKCIKENSYAVNVPIDNCRLLLNKEILSLNKLPSHINLSYRKTNGDDVDEFAINWLVVDTKNMQKDVE